MFNSKLMPSLVVLSALCGSYAAPDGGGVSYVLPNLANGEAVTAVVLGTANGQTSYSLGFGLPITTATTATAPDATITAGATLIEGSSEAHLVEIVTVGTEAVTYNEDCALSNGHAVCTVVAKNKATTVSTVLTVTQSASGVTVVTASATPKNGAGRFGAAGASVLGGVAAIVLAGAMM